MIELMTMPAGEELDSIVARKALTAKHEELEDGWWMVVRHGDDLVWCRPVGTPAEYAILFTVQDGHAPKFSTDANAALKLIAGEFEGNPDFDLMPIKTGWSVMFKVGKSIINITAETPSLAVCRAWLAWKEKIYHPAEIGL